MNNVKEVNMKHLICLMTGFILSLIPVTPPSAIAKEVDLPDAMQHMVKAPDIDFTNLRDPFASYLIRVRPHQNSSATSIEPQAKQDNRKREKLESYDLDTLRLVAIFSMGGERVAMIEDATTKGFIVRRGHYLGKHNGQIEKITDSTLFLVEEVLNPAGDVIDRQVSLTLNEVNE